MRYPGTPRQRFVVLVILALGLLIFDAVRKHRRRADGERPEAPSSSQRDDAPATPAANQAPAAPAQESEPPEGDRPAIGPAKSDLSHDWPVGPLEVEVRGRRFEWHYRLPGPDGRLETPDDRFAVNELHVPKLVDVWLTVRSDDYVYTYSVPGLALRRIAVPELSYPLEFRGSVAACYDVVADPMCRVRLYHGDLMGRLVVDEWPDFRAWFNSLPH